MLRGVCFRGVDLTGADFTEADIRGADFTDTILCRANFTNACAGNRLHVAIAQSVWAMLAGGALIVAAILLAAVFIVIVFDQDVIKQYSMLPALILAGFWLWSILAILRHGLTVRAVIRIAIAGAIAGAVAVAVALAGTVAVAIAVIGTVAVAVAVAVTIAAAGVAAGALAGAVVVVGTGRSGVAGAVVVAVAGAIAVAGAAATTATDVLAIAVAEAVTVALVVHVAGRVRREDTRFAVARALGLAVGGLGATRFRRANLASARFDGALLALADFREAMLTRVCWRGTRHLDLARVDSSILAVRAVRELLVTGHGASQSWLGCDLRGAYLEEADLSGANLTQTDLSGACLRGALLRDANLTECQAVGADFTRATLTGACLQAWNIDHTTTLTDVVCDYVFVLEHPNERGSRERRPHDPDRVFEPGDFAKLYTEIIDTVQILFRNGIDPGAFREALIQLGGRHPGLGWESIRAMERKDDDVLVTLDVPRDVDKAILERELQETYGQLRQLEAEKRHLLVAADRAHELAVALASRPVQVNQVVGQGNEMSQHNDSRRSIQIGNIGGDVHASGQALNLGDVHGPATATTNIGAAPALLSQAQWQQDVKTLMAELTDRMDALEDEVWRTTTAIFKKLHALNMDGKTEAQALATVDQALDANEKSALRRALTEIVKSSRSILEDVGAQAIWSALFGG